MVSFDVVRSIVEVVTNVLVGAHVAYQLGLLAGWWKGPKP
jgi:hypothetical protein